MICLIGNSGTLRNLKDGQTSKVRLYLKKIRDEIIDVDFIDLENFKSHPFSILAKIKKSIKKCDRIVLISARRGCRVLIPYINFINRKLKKPFVLPLIGTSVLHYSLDRLDVKAQNDFLVNGNYSLVKKQKSIFKQLSKIHIILPETDLLTKAFKDYYGLSNVITLVNFRDSYCLKSHRPSNNRPLRLIYVSRVASIKGIFDLIDVINAVNKEGMVVTLDIYGSLFLNKEELNQFNNCLCEHITYRGAIDMNEVVNIIAEYDLFVFPTRYFGEGAPGVIIESLLANTPILTSSFPQAGSLLNNGYDSIFYKMFDKNDLKDKLMQLVNNRNMVDKLRIGVREASKKYTYEHERDIFLKYVCGKEIQ